VLLIDIVTKSAISSGAVIGFRKLGNYREEKS
jgi:hypothetical protein